MLKYYAITVFYDGIQFQVGSFVEFDTLIFFSSGIGADDEMRNGKWPIEIVMIALVRNS